MAKDQPAEDVRPSSAPAGSALPLLPAWRQGWPGLVFLLRLVVLGLLLASYYHFDWLFVREVLTVSVTALLEASGIPATSLDSGTGFLILTEAGLFSITENCTYVDLFFLLAPLAWRTRLSFRANALRIGMLALAILAGNTLRIFLVIFLTQHQVSWFFAHELLDFGSHLSAVAVFAILALRSDLQAPGPRELPSPTPKHLKHVPLLGT